MYLSENFKYYPSEMTADVLKRSLHFSCHNAAFNNYNKKKSFLI